MKKIICIEITTALWENYGYKIYRTIRTMQHKQAMDLLPHCQTRKPRLLYQNSNQIAPPSIKYRVLFKVIPGEHLQLLFTKIRRTTEKRKIWINIDAMED